MNGVDRIVFGEWISWHRGDGPTVGDERPVTADDGPDVRVTHALGGIAGEDRAVAAAAVHEDFGGGVRDGSFEVAFEDAFAEVTSLGRVAGFPFLGFAHVEEHGLRIAFESGARFVGREFLDAWPRFVDQGEESRRMNHGTDDTTRGGRVKCEVSSQQRTVAGKSSKFDGKRVRGCDREIGSWRREASAGWRWR